MNYISTDTSHITQNHPLQNPEIVGIFKRLAIPAQSLEMSSFSGLFKAWKKTCYFKVIL